MVPSSNIISTHSQNEIDLQLMRISKYHSIIISKNVGSILLLIYLLCGFIFSLDNIPAFYILAANNFLPFLFSLVKKQNKDTKESFLPILSKKYNYSYIRYQCSSLSFVCVFVLLFLWQRREFSNLESFHLLSYTPLVILFAMFLLRTCGNIFYRHKLEQMLLNCNY